MSDSFVQFDVQPRTRGHVTDRWVVRSARSGDALGEIYWHGPGRRYVFEPMECTMYDASCLQAIALHCSTETQRRREAGKDGTRT